MMTGFQSYMGPGDKNLPRSEVSGYQPVSRIGEVVQNAFIDAHEWSSCRSMTAKDMTGLAGVNDNQSIESQPMFHEWATVQPGMICLTRKKKTAAFRQLVAAETAVPTIACVAGLPKVDEVNYHFAGVCRSASVRTPADEQGPNVDEFFTVAIGGMATLLNTSGGVVHPGDLIEWTFTTPQVHTSRTKQSPRRVGIAVASPSSARIVGRAISCAKKGESFDILIKM